MRSHRPLVFVDDTIPGKWGYWCLDCDLYRFGFASDIRPKRLAIRHEQETRETAEEMQEAC